MGENAVARYAASEAAYLCRTSDYGGVGYSQPGRWGFWHALDWEGWRTGPGEADCSSLVAGSYNIAFHKYRGDEYGDLAFPTDTWTGNLRDYALRRGFTDVGDTWTGSTPDGGFAVGDLLLVDPGHVAIAVRDHPGGPFHPEDPMLAEMWIDSTGDIDGAAGADGSEGDDTGGESRLVRYSAHPRTLSATWSTCLRYTGPDGDAPQDPTVGAFTVVDVSMYQHSADAVTAAVAAGARQVIVKSSEGVGYTDPMFHAHTQAALDAGVVPWFYHLARNDGPDGNAPAEEAEWFAGLTAPYRHAGTRLVLDWERPGDPSQTWWAAAWLAEVERLTGIRPLVYMSSSDACAYDWSAVAATYELWVAGYPATAPDYLTTALTCPYATGAWASPVGWQYTCTGRVPGYDGDLDMSVFWRAPGGGPAPALSPGRTRQGPWRDVTGIQAAVHAVVDNVVGPDTRLRVSCVAQASQWGGVAFPEGIAFTQECVGADPDGVWGPASQAAHDTTVAAVQAAVGVTVDCLWGDVTEAAVTAALDAGEQA